MAHPKSPTFGVAQEAADNNPFIQVFSEGNPDLQDSSWKYTAIEEDHWNKFYPYRLALYYKTPSGDWEFNDDILPPFTLPISPESLTISTPFAIVTTATLGGIVEEHNGTPFKMISLSGSTGILPLRGRVNPAAGGPISVASSIFAGTAQAFSQSQGLFQPKVIKNIVPEADTDSGALSKSTGYYQFKLLERFLESYAAFKKTKNGRNYALALELFKDGQILLVSPQSFNLRRSAANPQEYNYDLQLKAWRRVPPTSGGNHFENIPPVARDPGLLGRVLNGLQEGQRAMDAGRNILQGFQADVKHALFDPIREAIVFCKQALGVVQTAADMPSNIIKDLKEPLLQAVALKGVGVETANKVSSTFSRAWAEVQDLSVQVSKAAINAGRLGVGDTFHGAAPIGSSAASSAAGLSGNPTSHPAEDLFRNPDQHMEFFENVIPGNLQLPPVVQKKIQDENKRIRGLKREDFEASRDSIAKFQADFEASVGVNNTTYDSVYQTDSAPANRTATDTDFDIIFALNNVVMQFDKLAASATINRDEVSALDYVAGLANKAGIAFKVPQSKFQVPFPYGHTLEQLSAQYLGTPDRWHEIAALNGLVDPYVDETGFVLPLLTNGSGNQVTVSDASKLSVNQSVWISSSAQPRIVRRITKIETISPGMVVLTLTGDQNLEAYTIGASAYLQAFKANTINSQMTIFIPSDEIAPEDDFRYKAVPGVDYFDPLVRTSGIDLLLTPDGDLVVTSDGDGRLAVGLVNIIQKIWIVLNTPRGALLGHPEFGWPVQVGDSTADTSAADILKDCKALFKDDPSFSGVTAVTVLKQGPSLKVTLSVALKATGQIVPVTVTVPG